MGTVIQTDEMTFNADADFDRAISLIYFKPNATYNDYRESIELLKKHPGLILESDESIRYFRFYVRFPEILSEFLGIDGCSCNQKILNFTLSVEDLSAMIARTIEHGWISSLNMLLKYIKTHHVYEYTQIELKLLPGKYKIDQNAYELAKANGICDIYYDQCENKRAIYHHTNTYDKEKSGVYSGYRDAYHSLLYGNIEHLRGLLRRWNEWSKDCTFDAANDYFGLNDDKTSEHSLVEEKIWQLIDEIDSKEIYEPYN